MSNCNNIWRITRCDPGGYNQQVRIRIRRLQINICLAIILVGPVVAEGWRDAPASTVILDGTSYTAEQAAPMLSSMLRSTDENKQNKALDACKQLREALQGKAVVRDIENLYWRLSESDYATRHAAIATLGYILDTESRSFCMRVIRDGDPQAKILASSILTELPETSMKELQIAIANLVLAIESLSVSEHIQEPGRPTRTAWQAISTLQRLAKEAGYNSPPLQRVSNQSPEITKFAAWWHDHDSMVAEAIVAKRKLTEKSN